VLKVFEDRDALARAAAELFAKQAQKAVDEHGRFTVLLAGGETPRLTYEQLSQEPYRNTVPWKDIHFFWGDERCVPPDDLRSNALLAYKSLLDNVPVPLDHIHPIRCDRSPQHAADEYGVDLAEFFKDEPPRFDLVFLGLGDDGHTLSLLPDSKSLEEKLRWTAVTRRPEEKFSRVTLTAPIINQAKLVIFLVTGSSKAQVLQMILDGANDTPIYPAQLIQPESGDVRWYVDAEAGSLVGEKSGRLG
jgi:6-phosphogluconolactonase